jgi:sugar phosphate isomerase/epimerase
MISQFGVSTSICAGDVKKLAKGINRPSAEELVEGYLGLLEDCAVFVEGQGFNTIEIELGFSLINVEQLLPSLEKLKRILRPFDTVCGHLPIGEINISALNSFVRRDAIKETKRHIDICMELGIDKLVMHPGSFSSMPDRYLLLPDLTRDTAMSSVFDIFAYCNRKRMQLSVENLHCNEPFFQKPEEFDVFIDKGIALTLDCVHAVSCGVAPMDFIGKFGSAITEVHLGDAAGSDPFSDCAVGSGTVDCPGILQELEKIKYDGRIIIEVLSKEALIQSRMFLEERGYLK